MPKLNVQGSHQAGSTSIHIASGVAIDSIISCILLTLWSLQFLRETWPPGISADGADRAKVYLVFPCFTLRSAPRSALGNWQLAGKERRMQPFFYF